MATSVAAMPVTDPTTRSAVLDAARTPVAQALHKPVMFKVRHLAQAGDWAFLLADMEEHGAAPLDYRDTPMAAPAAQGYMSRKYAALLRKDGERWTVVEKAIGPSDVPWGGWAKRYGAPDSIFALQ